MMKEWDAKRITKSQPENIACGSGMIVMITILDAIITDAMELGTNSVHIAEEI